MLKKYSETLHLNKFSCSLVKGGNTNIIYKIFIDNVSQPLILRASKSKDYKKIQKEVQLHRYLNSVGIQCPKVLQINGKKQEYFQININEDVYPAIFLQYIEGSYPSNVVDFYQVGKMLGKLHSVPPPPFLMNENSGFNLTRFYTSIIPREIILYGYSVGLDFNKLINFVDKETSNLKSGLCHSDFFRINALISNHGCYMIDLESMGTDCLLFDLGMTCFGMITPRFTTINDIHLNSLLYGYEKNRQLTLREKRVLPYVIVLAALKVAIWRYNYSKNNPQHKEITSNLWKEAIMAAVNWNFLKI
ncbi:phosphotransferase [Bacillus thuringiensis]|uniref:phosphotransferase n=1 Tax=Bacillus thuringiensis TaxID=1428 RepID=UPI000BFC01B9|nr:phosphotransferase [Bacillus thuringiensis]PGO54958.1 hypothetical protein CN986_15710 [Bacillus thuringiensis]